METQEESYQVADIGDSDSERVSELEVVEDAETQESEESYQVADIGDSDPERVSEFRGGGRCGNSGE
ncbi:hypothetical protein [Limnospira fusiformis]|uniref:hypothetical protein n=1 Tax=Limnospira fusiformis TaxID=54297 RepID=UPI0014493EA7|nr:hypothetical protein HFV01_14970 [Limnospira fusiformis SAG 85.79]